MVKKMKSKEYLKLLAKIELSRNEFWYFCRTVCPSFYKEERKYLKELCYQFQRFYETNEYTTMVISIGPRHGKTLTCKLFIRWILGKNKQEKVILASYNTTLSGLSSKEIRDAIMEEKIEAWRGYVAGRSDRNEFWFIRWASFRVVFP